MAVFAIGVGISWYAGELDRQQHISRNRAEVQSDLSDFRARLETKVYTAIAMAQGLAAQLVYQEGLPPGEFTAIAAELRRNNPYILNLALAPGFEIRQVYPPQGSELTLGLNLLQDEAQKGPMLRAINLDAPVLAGPFELRQGGNAVVGRMPVWVNRDGVPRLWGAVSVALNYEKLMADAGVDRLEKDLTLGILGLDASGPGGEPVRGQRLGNDLDPVRVPVFLPGGSWLMQAAPRDGWYSKPWWMTLAGAFGLLLSLFAAIATGRILWDRRRIRELASVDALTALPNRRQALEHLTRLISRGRRGGQSFALLAMDLNGFKPVNDTYGHAAGDHLLSEIGRRLHESLRPGDLVARMGGDEFLLLVATESGTDDVALLALAQRAQVAVSRPVSLQGEWVVVGASIGIARYPQDGDDAGVLLRRADEAMYRAKREAAEGVEFARPGPPSFSPEPEDDADLARSAH
jgi:diguanylate cyclase (GGDEF)-like protein